MLKRGIAAGLFAPLVVVICLVAMSNAAPLATAATHSTDCSVMSCTVYLPLIMKPLPPIPPQFEVTQGVQQPDNPVKLIAGRATYVRWTLTSGAADTNVSAYLSGARDGVALSGSPLSALNNPRTLPAAVNRAVLDDTFNFRLPADWTTGDIALHARASNASGFFTYTTAANFHFTPGAAMQVKVVPIAYHCTSGGTSTTTPAAPYDYLIAYTFRTYPVPAIGLSTHASIAYGGPCNGSGVPLPWSSADPNNFVHWQNMLAAITNVWISEGRPNIYYYGLLTPDCSGGCVAGIGWIGGYQAAVGFDGFGAAHSGASETHAHEVGHNHGRNHVWGCGAGNATPSFPYLYPDNKGRIGNDAHQNYGFNLDTLAIYTYPSYYDVMTYCGPEWISDYTYTAIWNYANVALAQRSTQSIGARSFLISGVLDPATDRASFNPVYALDIPAYQPETGDYVLEMLNANRQVVASYSFAAVSAQPDRFFAPDPAEEISGFHLALPYRDDVAGLRVRRSDALLGVQTAGRIAPRLIPISPPFGINRSGQIAWSGYSSARTALSYLVRASTDGGQAWQTIAVDQTTPAITLSADDFGGQVVRLQVIGSDGLRSSTLALGPYWIPGK